MKKIQLATVILLALVFYSTAAEAQGRFDAYLFGGLNMCQIDGDDAGHYNHPGLRAGVGTSFALSDDSDSPWRMVVELAYSQKGSYINSTNGEISLQYVELPLLLSYNSMEGRLRIAAGVAPAVKVGTYVAFYKKESPNHEALYRSFDALPATVSVSYMLSRHIGIEGRWQTSLLSITDGTSSGIYRIFRSNKGTFNRLLTASLIYRF